jgi:hypothetical protein
MSTWCYSHSCASYLCGCSSSTSCNSCSTPAGCAIQLDFSCILYHKDNNDVSELDGLSMTNGATLEAVIEAIDEKVKQLNVPSFTLTYLRASYVVNTLQQFAQSVDTELDLLRTDIDTSLASSQTFLVATDSATIDFTVSGTLNHSLTGSVKLSSAVSGNRLTAQADGLHVTAQTLSVNASTKELTISDGNTVSIASILSSASGWLGNLASDPSSPTDGQYWFRTDLSASAGLRIRLNGNTRTITTS